MHLLSYVEKKDTPLLKITVIKVLVIKPFTAVDKINSLNDYFASIYSGNDILSYRNNVSCKCDIVFLE